MNSKRLTAMGLIVALSISAVACSGAEEEAEEAGPVAVEVLTPKTGELTVDTAYIGTVAPQEQVYVIPKASGTVTETFFEVGDQVQEGDVLFKIDDEAAQLQMANAKAAYESAQAGVTAQNGGARDLQNFQTEEQIRQLRKSLYDSGEPGESAPGDEQFSDECLPVCAEGESRESHGCREWKLYYFFCLQWGFADFRKGYGAALGQLLSGQ